MKKILIAGGAGFLGSHLCERLVHEGNYVVCVDNFHTGDPKNVTHLVGKPNFQLIEWDIIQPLPSQDLDEIYNLASPASPPHYQKNPVQTLKTNFIGSLNLLELAKEQSAKILQASTSEVYGDPFVHPQPENYWGHVNPIGPRACYDEGKRSAETLFFEYHRQHKVKIKVARIFNTYGPRMNEMDGRVIVNFIQQALRNEALTVYGKGKQTRSFCYVSDEIEGLIRFMSSDDKLTGPINIGNPDEFTILELAQKVLEMTNSRSKIIFQKLPTDDPQQRRPDISLARSQLNWEPRVTLELGLQKTVDFYKRS